MLQSQSSTMPLLYLPAHPLEHSVIGGKQESFLPLKFSELRCAGKATLNGTRDPATLKLSSCQASLPVSPSLLLF
jgi:hypothetical protein